MDLPLRRVRAGQGNPICDLQSDTNESRGINLKSPALLVYTPLLGVISLTGIIVW